MILYGTMLLKTAEVLILFIFQTFHTDCLFFAVFFQFHQKIISFQISSSYIPLKHFQLYFPGIHFIDLKCFGIPINK